MTSLRSRYILFSIVLTVLITAALWFASQRVRSNNEESLSSLEVRREVQQISTQLRDNIWKTDFTIYSYLLTPTTLLREQINDSLQQLADDVDTLTNNSWTNTREKRDILSKLTGYVHIMQQEVVKLIEIRENREKRFPSLTIINDVLYPANIEFVTASSLAMADISSSQLTPAKSEALQLLQSIDAIWRRMISSFRLLVAYRTETVGDPQYGMPVQVSNIDMLHTVVRTNLKRLKAMNQAAQLGFEARDAIEQMLMIADQWFSSYEKVSSIHTSGEWRSDDRIIFERLQPISEKIRQQLYKLDDQIEISARQEIQSLTLLSETIIRNNWVLGGAILLFIVSGFYYLQRRVLRPISNVVDGLNAQARDNEHTSLPTPRTREVFELVHAFNYLSDSLAASEKGREKAEAMARHADKMSTVGELASCVAHEINNPLNNMARLTEFIQDEVSQEIQNNSLNKDFDILHSEMHRCADIVKNLMDFGRPGEPRMSDTDLCQLANESWRLLEHKARDNKVTMRVECPASLPSVHADHAQIQQVFVNLILNAIQFSPDGGTIHIAFDIDNSDLVRCRVTDQGVGADKTELSRFFDPFYTTKQGHEGMGLGLSVCHSIIDNHHGTMGAIRNIPHGVCIWFTLPVSELHTNTMDDN